MPVAKNGTFLANIVCPFFQRESAMHHNIVCEGPDFWSSVSVNYNNEKARQAHLRQFCCTFAYKECKVCRLISNPNYEEGDELGG